MIGDVMPSTISLYACAVWFGVAFFLSTGWAIWQWIVGRLLRKV